SGAKVEYDVAVDTGLGRSGPPIDLKAHVGQQVQLTVRPVEPTAAPGANPTAQTAGVRPTEPKPARVIVTNIKSLGTSCSGDSKTRTGESAAIAAELTVFIVRSPNSRGASRSSHEHAGPAGGTDHESVYTVFAGLPEGAFT